jgi:deoxyguanosine kinase
MTCTIVSIEGNIGSGKSTILSNLREKYKDNHRVIFIDEPTAEWDDVRDTSGKTILAKFYENPQKYAFPFQMLAFISRIEIMRKTISMNKDKYQGENLIFVTERGTHTDKHVFAKMLFDTGQIEDVNYQIYTKWFDAFANDFAVDKIIYIRTPPEICRERIAKRQREGESIIELEYLQQCHVYHDTMMENLQGIPQLNIKGKTDISQSPQIMEEWLWTIDQFIV